MALSGLASSSKKLLRAPLVLSVVAFVIGLGGLLGAVGLGVAGYDFWNTVFLGLGALGLGIILFFLGLIGEQVRIIALTVRDVPLVIEAERINFPKGVAFGCQSCWNRTQRGSPSWRAIMW